MMPAVNIHLKVEKVQVREYDESWTHAAGLKCPLCGEARVWQHDGSVNGATHLCIGCGHEFDYTGFESDPHDQRYLRRWDALGKLEDRGDTAKDGGD